MRRPAKQGVVLVLGLGCSVAFLGLAFGGLDFARFLQAVRRAELWPWLPMAVLCYLAGHIVRGLRCKFHGGMSTGPKTPEGKARSAQNGKKRRSS